ncbi:AMP-binding protein [Bradyrhizobium sp. 153]|uniref:AMP-binding protein n=1 Tax=Bradyrhizobium sp. 153 TaxID=2782627 RepID=UPI0031F887F1|nr:AMP-binding protein [Bradyrhizobium sp. 153]
MSYSSIAAGHALLANRVHSDSIRQALSVIPHRPSVVWFEDGVDRQGEFHLDALLRTSRSSRVAVARSLDDPYVINYTSGTTGAPKGAIQSERSNYVAGKNTAIISDAQREDVFFHWEPFYHGAAWKVVMVALQRGLKIHMVERFSASRLWNEIARADATKLHYLGGLVNIILAQPQAESDCNNKVSIAWGGACPRESWRKFEEHFDLKVREGYGLTEGQMFTHIKLRGVIGSIGTPIEQLDSWIADEQGKQVGPGVSERSC